MRIVIDLDGTICFLKEKGQSYADVLPRPGAIETMKELRAKGHYIIISTARNMATQEANLGKVLKNVGLITLQWLENHDVPYDEIYFGKPNGEIYIDDRAFRFENWDDVTEESLHSLSRPK
jgi:capsule biosynthesis phosphatase